MCERQVSDSLRSNLCNENATETFPMEDLSADPHEVSPGCLQRKGQTGGAGYHQYIGEFSKSPFQGQSTGLVIQMDPWVPAVIRLAVW